MINIRHEKLTKMLGDKRANEPGHILNLIYSLQCKLSPMFYQAQNFRDSCLYIFSADFLGNDY